MNLYTTSIDIIRAGQARSGAYVASPTFSQYGYSWLRDGTWIALGMDCAGQHASAHAFYQWVGRTLEAQRPRLETLLGKLARGETPDDLDYLPTRFTLDGAPGEDFWWDFQLDGYGTWLWGLVDHVGRTGDDDLWAALRPAVELTARYLGALWQVPNYDCWEEHRDRIHLSTLAAIYGGLDAVCQRAPDLVPPDLPQRIRDFALGQGVAAGGHLVKYLGTETVDASLLWTAVPYRLVKVDDPRFEHTLAQIERDLHRPGGGVYRYAADTYYGGGEWILLTAWLAWVYAERGEPDRARPLLDWIAAQAGPDGALPEQVPDHRLFPDRYAEWEAKWGTIARPLLWSHAMWLIVTSRLGEGPCQS
ncbi:MAG: glycoside hydrolase family 15 protein [Chloroflexi bacterium]|nr:glycoside hydrolase family 15 protein [Chloroflexota bacterium]